MKLKNHFILKGFLIKRTFLGFFIKRPFLVFFIKMPLLGVFLIKRAFLVFSLIKRAFLGFFIKKALLGFFHKQYIFIFLYKYSKLRRRRNFEYLYKNINMLFIFSVWKITTFFLCRVHLINLLLIISHLPYRISSLTFFQLLVSISYTVYNVLYDIIYTQCLQTTDITVRI